jgi:hypothetical protein
MQRPRRDTRLPWRYRSSSPPQFLKTNDLQKRRRINVETVDRNDVDQALAVIAPAPECSNEPPQFISTELPYFKANCVQNRLGYTMYTNLSEIGFFELFLATLWSKYCLKKPTLMPNPSFEPISLLSRKAADGYLLRLQRYVCI